MGKNNRQHTTAKKYHGLVNQGATCYLNSVLQVLFMTKDFREAVKRESASSDKKCTYQLKSLFQELEKSTATTSNITDTLGIRVCEQRDAAEYFEKILNDTSPEASQIFQGELTHKNTCKECNEDRSTTDLFWSLPLRLEPNNMDYNVEEGIIDFFKVIDTNGENNLYCHKCDAKTDAKIELEMTRHPEVLTLLLKRFKFDYRYQEYVKIKRAVTVPDTLQIPENFLHKLLFSNEELNGKIHNRWNNALRNRMMNATQLQARLRENQTYELYAFVEHSGELTFGHYTVTIKSQDDNKWYNFSDTSVTSCTEESIQKDRIHMRKKMQDTRGLATLQSTSNEQQGAGTRKRDNEDKGKQENDKDRDTVKKRRKAEDQQEEMKKEEDKGDGQCAQITEKTNKDYGESGKKSDSCLLADDNQNSVEQNQGQEGGHKGVCMVGQITEHDKTKENKHDGDRKQSLVSDALKVKDCITNAQEIDDLNDERHESSSQGAETRKKDNKEADEGDNVGKQQAHCNNTDTGKIENSQKDSDSGMGQRSEKQDIFEEGEKQGMKKGLCCSIL